MSTAEANQRQANEHMRRLVETTRENTQTLRGASQDLTSSCAAATVSIESAAGGAQAMQSSILGFIEQIGVMQHSIVQGVAQQTATTQKIGESIQQTAEQFSGSTSRGGIRGMAQSLSAMAGDLDNLCRLRESV